MTTLALNKPRPLELADFNDLPAVGSDIVFEGAAVGDNGSGFARPLVAGDPFRGIAVNKTDNSTGANGAKTVRVLRRGSVQLPIASLAITDVGKDVYASDDDVFTLTPGSNTRIGYVARWVETGVGVVYIEEAYGNEVALTDSSGGTASDTIAVIGVTYDQAEVRNAVASLAAKVNYLLQKMGR